MVCVEALWRLHFDLESMDKPQKVVRKNQLTAQTRLMSLESWLPHSASLPMRNLQQGPACVGCGVLAKRFVCGQLEQSDQGTLQEACLEKGRVDVARCPRSRRYLSQKEIWAVGRPALRTAREQSMPRVRRQLPSQSP